MKRLASCILVFAVVLGVSGAPSAGATETEDFGIRPQPERVDDVDRNGFQIPREVGATFEDTVRIYNRTESPLELALYAADAPSGPGGTVDVGIRSSERKGVGAWIDLSESEVVLAPLGSTTVSFKVEVQTADPNPDLGAIVIENTESGLATDASARAWVLVRTSPPGSPTTSVRARPIIRSPWFILGIIGLLVALGLVYVGTMRARRPKDKVVAAGGIEDSDEPPALPAEPVPASRPVIRRLGEREREPDHTETTEHPRFSAAQELVDRPLLDDDMLVELDAQAAEEDEVLSPVDDGFGDEDLPMAGTAMGRSKPAARKAKPKAKTATPRKPARKAGAAKAKAKPKPKTSTRKKPAARKPAPRKKVVRKATPKAKASPPDFIPLDDV